MVEYSALAAVVDALPGARVLCVGDVMLDRFVYGQVERISPEAPIPILRVERERSMLGGAGNVVRNLAVLGAETCFVSVIGDDPAGRDVTRLVAAEPGVEPHLLTQRDRGTTIKLRYVAGAQQLLRADSETIAAISSALETQIVQRAIDDLDRAAVVVLSDYGKGVLTREATRRIIEAARARGRIVLVDPKGSDYGRYRGANLLKPNRRELAEAARMPVDSDEAIVAAARHLIKTCDVKEILVTRSQDGMTLIGASGEPRHLPARAREVFDVSGAGDTVIATLAAALAIGQDTLAAARLANAAAGIVVGKIGTAVAERQEIQAALHSRDLMTGEAKTVTLAQAQDRVAAWRAKGLKIGFTNGCFDLLHPGHVSLLTQARAACDRLIVGLNADASVKRLKGATRPVQSEAARAVVLGSLASVDLVVLFAEDTPLELIRALKPDVLVKGADYTIETVVGADVVQSYGGRVLLADLMAGHSTTATLKKIAAG
jgi:D-beta-D-heptose 7-phosphate kinase/D-beta-D-heptose 1-phosphate adenosyltransferase